MTYDDWAASLDSASVPVDDHELDVAYYDEGEGPVVVFLHGIPTSSFLWRDVVPAVAEDHRVIVPDMVGYGQSAQHDGFDRSIRAQEEMVANLLDELGVDRVTFVGHDLGGGVGLRLAVHRPDLVDRLVLSNGVAYDSWPIETIVTLGLPSEIGDMSVDKVQEMLDGLFRNTLYSDDPDEEFVEAMKSPWQSEEGIVSLSRNAIATNTSHTTEIDPAEIEAETLLLWGADDEFQPIDYAERLEDDVDDATLVGLDDANHWVMADRPEEYTDRLVDFLT